MANQPQIELQLTHPDAFFFQLQPSREGVSGMFQGDDHIPFEVCRADYLEAAQRCRYIGDYNEKPGGKVWVSDSYEGRYEDEEGWIAYTCEEYPIANDILKEVFRLRLERQLRLITEAMNVREVGFKQVDASIDETFCEAVLELADIIRSLNPDWVEYRELKSATA